MSLTTPLSRLALLSAGLILASAGFAQDGATKKSAAKTAAAPAAATKQPVEPPLAWHDVTSWGVEGRAWPEMERKRWFDRLPAVADGKVTAAVWGLSRDSAGMMVRFKTDAASIHARYKLAKSNIAMPKVRVLTAHHPFWRDTTTSPTISDTKRVKYTKAPALNGKPKSFTKNNSKLPAI